MSGKRHEPSGKLPFLGSEDEFFYHTRFTRLTNAFSKKLDNLKAACALHFAYYNFCRIHQSLRVTPATEAGIADHAWKIRELLA